MPGISYNTTTHDYHTTVDSDKILCTFVPNSAVKTVQLKVTGGSIGIFDSMSIDMYMPFPNTKTFINTINTYKKYMNQIPSAFTTGNPT